MHYAVKPKELKYCLVKFCPTTFEVTSEDHIYENMRTIVNNTKMTHTKELSNMQGPDFIFSNCEEIEFCPICKGTGEIGDCGRDLSQAVPCDKCKCTGRVIK